MMTSRWLAYPLGLILALGLSSCVSEQGNHLRYGSTPAKATLGGMTVGALLSGLAETNVPVGILFGAAAGGSLGYLAQSRTGAIYRLVNAGIPVIEYGENTIVVLPSDRFFDPDSAHLLPESTYVLNLVTTLLQSMPNNAITIAAYTDDVGTYDHNMLLSNQQANQLTSYFWSHGIDQHRMRPVPYGIQPNVASNKTSLGSHFNRRVEVMVHPPIQDKSPRDIK